MNEQTETNRSDEDKLIDKVQSAPIFWIPFGIASIILVIVGLFRFSQESDSAFFIYICLIAFAVAALPWISSFKVPGLFEVQRAIDQVRDEGRDRVDQVSNRFDDKLLLLGTELVSQLNSVQTSIQNQFSQQASYQTSQQASEQDQVSANALTVNIGTTLKEIERQSDLASMEENNTEQALVRRPKADSFTRKPDESDQETFKDSPAYQELVTGFAQATAAALSDPLGSKCGNLIRQMPDTGLSVTDFEEAQLKLKITNEQIKTMEQLKLLRSSISTNTEEIIEATSLGRTYADYWQLRKSSIDLISPILVALAPFAADAAKGAATALWKTITANLEEAKKARSE